MPDDRPRLKFITAIIADDIRRETNGKEIYIGVYTARMVIGQFAPDFGVFIAISVIFESPEPANVPMIFRVSGPNDEEPVEIRGMASITEETAKSISAASLAGIPILITRSGNIVVEAKNYDEDDWQIVRMLPVVANPDDPGLRAGNISRLAAIASAPLSSQSQPDAAVSSSPPGPSRPARPRRRPRF